MVMAPSMASKVNTVAQIVLAGLVLGLLGLDIRLEQALFAGYAVVAI